MNHIISCVNCELEYRGVKNGAGVETAGEIYSADILQCPGCGHEIASRARAPIAAQHQTSYAGLKEKLTQRSRLVRSWPSLGAKYAETMPNGTAA